MLEIKKIFIYYILRRYKALSIECLIHCIQNNLFVLESIKNNSNMNQVILYFFYIYIFQYTTILTSQIYEHFFIKPNQLTYLT